MALSQFEQAIKKVAESIQPPKCTSCPECGETDFFVLFDFGKDHRVCAKCKQEWFTTIFYPIHINHTSY